MMLVGLASCHIGYTQPILAPIDTSLEPSLTNQSVPPGIRRTTGLSETAPIQNTPASSLRWGPFDVRPHVIYRILYSDGLQVAPGRSTSTTINSFSPGFLVEFGTHWIFDYTPTWNEYTSKDFKDTLDHTAKLAWGTSYGAWVLRASQDFNRTTTPLIQTGRQTRQTDHVTNINASYLFASNLSAETALNRSSRLVSDFNDTHDWSITEFLHVKTTPQLDSALGVKYGEVKASDSPDMYFFQYLARVAWQATNKLSMELQGGLENRHIDQTGADNLLNPVINALVLYRPVETTQLSFSASRDTSVSYFSNQIIESSRYGILLEQRLLTRFRATAGLEHQEAEFRSTLPSAFVGRKDKNYSFTAGLRTTVLRRVDLTLQYRRSRNTSNVEAFEFTSNQVGLEVGYRY